jgi:hypothetical protein
MSRKFIVAIAAVAALGMSTLITTDASARFGGGGGGGFHSGGNMSSGGARSFSRTSFSPSRITTNRVTSRTVRTTNVNKTHIRPNTHRPNPHRPNPQYGQYKHHHHGHHWWAWCRHHHHHRCGWYPWVDVGYVDGDVVPAVADAAPVVATPVAAVCNDCDYFLKDEPGCYMAKRAFSTPAGDELRCVKICEEAEQAK